MAAKRWLYLVLLVLSAAPLLWAQPRSVRKDETPTGGREIGILFSTDDILFNLEGYQQGIGVKISAGKWMVRGMVDMLLNTGIDPFSISLGGVFERHLLPGPISLYFGPLIETGLTISTAKIDADNWTQDISLPLLTAGGVFGIEIFVFDFLSVFLEYQAALALGMNIDRISTAGSISSTTDFTYKFDVGLGNSGKFGIVFYIMRRE